MYQSLWLAVVGEQLDCAREPTIALATLTLQTCRGSNKVRNYYCMDTYQVRYRHYAPFSKHVYVNLFTAKKFTTGHVAVHGTAGLFICAPVYAHAQLSAFGCTFTSWLNM